MSGGHWNYCHFQMMECIQNVADEGAVIKRFPKISQIFSELGVLLEDTIHELDYDFSGDSEIENDAVFEKEFVENLGKIIGKKLVLKVYEVEEMEQN